MRTLLILSLVLFGCSDDKTNNTPPADAAAPMADAPAAAPDVAKYCTDITAHCTGANAQYPSMDQCLGTAATFPVGTSADTSGETLGCRAYHAGTPAMTDPGLHCVHAGPGGSTTDATGANVFCGDACTSFCTIELKVCGTKASPLAGITAQYQDMPECLNTCANFNKTHKFGLGGTPAAPVGDSLACRLFHATNAALYTKMGDVATTNIHCGHTGPNGGTNVNTCMTGTTPAP